MKQRLIPSNTSRGVILSEIYDLEIKEKAYFNMFQDGGACIIRFSADSYVLYSITLYGGEERVEMYGDWTDIKSMVDEALSCT